MASFRKRSSAKVITVQPSPLGAPTDSPGPKSGDPLLVHDVASNEHVFTALLMAPGNSISFWFPFYRFWVRVACSGPVIILGAAAAIWTVGPLSRLA
jgi:hypothetical protein